MKEIGKIKITSGKSEKAKLCVGCDLHTKDYHVVEVGESVLLMCDYCARQLANVILKGNVSVTRSKYESKKCLTPIYS